MIPTFPEWYRLQSPSVTITLVKQSTKKGDARGAILRKYDAELPPCHNSIGWCPGRPLLSGTESNLLPNSHNRNVLEIIADPNRILSMFKATNMESHDVESHDSRFRIADSVATEKSSHMGPRNRPTFFVLRLPNYWGCNRFLAYRGVWPLQSPMIQIGRRLALGF